MRPRLEQSWDPGAGGPHGGFRFRLVNAGGEALTVRSLCYASMTRLADGARVAGGRVVRREANHVEIALDAPAPLPPGGVVTVDVAGLTHAPANRTQGAMGAWLVLADGATRVLDVGDLQPPPGTARGPVKDWPAGDRGIGLACLPWPAAVDVADLAPAPPLRPAPGTDPAPFALVAALHRRLFPAAPSPFALDPDGPGRMVRVAAGDHPPGGYALDFGPDAIALTHADADGLRHGLVTLAQAAHAARLDPRFGLPRAGRIVDAPRHGWRGCHLDVARNFRPAGAVTALLDVMAWSKLNRFHWHLSDDEGYRLPSDAFPDLARTGARRGGDAPLAPQYADGPQGQAGGYDRSEVAAVVAHAAALGIEVVPEIDMPGHVSAILAALPDLRDPGEPAGAYRSVQGYANNAFNPGLDRTYAVVATLLDEVAGMFPGPVLHVGGDEVSPDAWARSPAARALAARLGLRGAMALQAHFLGRVRTMVHDLGRVMGGWDECALGGGVPPGGVVLMAWRTEAMAADLVARGYDVVATPGQAYYLDMVQGSGWDAAGTSWAGAVPPSRTYAHEVSDGLPDGPGRLLGVQACIWTEHVDDVARLNDMAFPRLHAVAEAAWTPAEAKDWPRFAALARTMPRL